MIRRCDGTVEEFPGAAVALPLGVADEVTYQVLKRTLEPGETAVIYTDGVSEAMNPAGDLYGAARLRELIAKNAAPPAKLGQAILADVKRHAAGRAQNDDITLMAFGRVETG